MCRVARADFEDDLTAPADARRWVGGRLEDWGLQGLAEIALLLVSEVVTNAVVHAHSPPAVSMSVAEGTLEIGVSDRVLLLPAAPEAAGDPGTDTALVGEGGRGLLLVALLADTWGCTRLSMGKHVWFHLDVDGWNGRGACVCGRPHPARVHLDSGRYARHLTGKGRAPRRS